jgi:hypothetical protein
MHSCMKSLPGSCLSRAMALRLLARCWGLKPRSSPLALWVRAVRKDGQGSSNLYHTHIDIQRQKDKAGQQEHVAQ